ncbi:31213_t:CDS:2, partial [Racocetra persica]
EVTIIGLSYTKKGKAWSINHDAETAEEMMRSTDKIENFKDNNVIVFQHQWMLK